MAMSEQDLRRALVDTARRMNAAGINQGTSGNLSVRLAGGLLITPSGMAYDHMEPGDVVAIGFDGRSLGGSPDGGSPSSEWRLHADLLRCRPEVSAVVHCHSVHATALACHGRAIPPFHYMVVMAGGADVRCAPYATFGSQELSDRALEALVDRKACLLAQHGQVALGKSLAEALRLAVEVETLSRMYLQALQLGEPSHLSAAEMARVTAKMEALHYGQSC